MATSLVAHLISKCLSESELAEPWSAVCVSAAREDSLAYSRRAGGELSDTRPIYSESDGLGTTRLPPWGCLLAFLETHTQLTAFDFRQPR